MERHVAGEACSTAGACWCMGDDSPLANQAEQTPLRHRPVLPRDCSNQLVQLGRHSAQCGCGYPMSGRCAHHTPYSLPSTAALSPSHSRTQKMLAGGGTLYAAHGHSLKKNGTLSPPREKMLRDHQWHTPPMLTKLMMHQPDNRQGGISGAAPWNAYIITRWSHSRGRPNKNPNLPVAAVGPREDWGEIPDRRRRIEDEPASCRCWHRHPDQQFLFPSRVVCIPSSCRSRKQQEGERSWSKKNCSRCQILPFNKLRLSAMSSRSTTSQPPLQFRNRQVIRWPAFQARARYIIFH